jgi:uncharacterized protein (DUF952 family)
MDQIVHICSLEDWQAAQVAGEYRADSLAAEGFIHCSRPAQVIGVANHYYAGRTDLLLLWIDPSKLVVELRWEPSEGDIYPHLYGPLNLAAIIQVSSFPPDTAGVFRYIPETG